MSDPLAKRNINEKEVIYLSDPLAHWNEYLITVWWKQSSERDECNDWSLFQKHFAETKQRHPRTKLSTVMARSDKNMSHVWLFFKQEIENIKQPLWRATDCQSHYAEWQEMMIFIEKGKKKQILKWAKIINKFKSMITLLYQSTATAKVFTTVQINPLHYTAKGS